MAGGGAMISNLDVLAKDEVRTAILLTEIGGWIHMLGKMDDNFIRSQATNATVSYDDLDVSKNWFASHIAFCDLLRDGKAQTKLKFASPNELKNAPEFLNSFIRRHRGTKPGVNLLKLLFDSHGQASGTEKGTLPETEGKQTQTHTFAANAFGYEDANDNLLNRSLDNDRKPVVALLGTALSQVLTNTLTEAGWKKLYYQDRLKKKLSEILSLTVGDTRRPANEVTLWDQTVTAASLLKTGLVKNILEGSWRDPLVNTFADKYRWRFLRVYFDGLAFIANSHHPADIRGRWNALREAQNAVRQLLEVTYSLAAEAYCDEANLVFVVPDIDDLHKATFNNITKETLEDRLRAVFAAEVQNEIEPQVALSESSRGAINLGKALGKEISSPQPSLKSLQAWWSGEIDEQCTVCRVRPQGYGDGDAEKARNRNVCVVCLERREMRSSHWIDHLPDTTIWIDEAADDNGRVALIAGKFDLSGWLEGYYLQSIAGRKLPKDAGFGTTDFSAITSAISGSELSQPNLNTTTFLQSMQQGTNIPEKLSPADIYKILVTERDLTDTAPNLSSADPADYDLAARFLFQGFFAKTTSFARLRRIWETTGEFWENARDALGGLAGKQKYRLVLHGTLSNSIGPSHVYDVEIGKVKASFVYDENKNEKRLISADNLRYLAKQLELKLPDKPDDKIIAEAVKQRLEDSDNLELFEKPSRQESLVRKPKRIAEIRDFTVELEEHNYSPVIPLLAEPQIFIALVPADKAIKVITHLRDEYERQMSKVRNRLPLHLNLLTFNRRLPLYVAMDAVRRMLDRKTCSHAQWRVVEVSNFDDSGGKLGKHARRLKLAPTGDDQGPSKQINASVSYSLGDGNEDFYYPYFFVTQANEDKAKGGEPLTDRPHHWQAIHPTYKPAVAHGFTDLVHVSELCKDDVVLYSPSTFDFEHLDVAGRRFELNYETSGIRIAPANRLHPSTRPFLIEEIADLEKVWNALRKLPVSQRDFLVRLIETKRTDWKVNTDDDVILRRFACDTLKQKDTKQKWWNELDGEQRRLLEEWATRGRLADVLELYEKMMKLEAQEGEKS